MEHSFGFSNVNKPVVFKTDAEIKTHRNLKDVLLKIVKNSPKPGSAVGGKGKKRGQIRKTSASEASPVVAWVGEKGAEPGDMPLMSLFHDTRLWYHALIGQMSSC